MWEGPMFARYWRGRGRVQMYARALWCDAGYLIRGSKEQFPQR